MGYPDLMLLWLWRGLHYAFPRAMERHRAPRLKAACEATAALPEVHAYLASDACMAFNEHGIFRAYPELDDRPER